MITDDFASFSPDGNYAVRFYDYTQINPYQSSDLILRYKFEIVKDKCMGESGIHFEDGFLDYFPEVFPDFNAGELSHYRAYVSLKQYECRSSNYARYRERYFYWSADSRFFTIFAISVKPGEPNRIITFDVKAKQYRSVEFKGIPENRQLHAAGDQLTAVLKRKDVAVNLVMDLLTDNKAAEEKPKSRLVRVDEPGGAKGEKAEGPDTAAPAAPLKDPSVKDAPQPDHSASRKLARIFWSIFIPGMMATFGIVSYVLTGVQDIDPGLRWKIVAAVTAVGTICASLIQIFRHRMYKKRLRRYLGIGYVVGKDYSVFFKILGKPSSKIPAYITDQNNRQGYIATWTGYNYQIAILFYYDNNKCVSIKHEVLPDLS